MTDRTENVKRVISTLESIKSYCESKATPRRPLKQIRWALTCAIESMKEVEQYRALGTVEELKEAREKQVAVEHHHTRVDNITDKVRKSVCPKCLGMIYTYREEYPNYCTNCGQKIDWSEEDD